MSYAQIKKNAIDKIPVIDAGPLRKGEFSDIHQVAMEIRQVAEEVGFFYLCNHGISQEVISQAYGVSKSFFRKPKQWKNNLKINSNHHGFLSIGEARMERAKNVDLKESFVWGLDLPDSDPLLSSENPFLGRNQWPGEMPELKDGLYPFFEAGLKCGRDLMRAFAIGMGLHKESFTKNFNEPIARGSIIYYPPQPPDMDKTQFGVAPHTDYGCLTLLWQDQVGGLEVLKNDGEWVPAHPIEGTIVVNVGDLLMRWTNNAFKSTQHRVVNRKGIERYSMVVAWDPDYGTVVDPSLVCQNGEKAQYPPIRCGDYVLSRFDSSFSYRQ